IRSQRILVDVQEIPDRPPDQIAIEKANQTAEDARLEMIASKATRAFTLPTPLFARTLGSKATRLISKKNDDDEYTTLDVKHLIGWQPGQQRTAQQRIKLKQSKQAQNNPGCGNQFFVPAA